MKKINDIISHNKGLIFIILLSCIPLFDLLHSGLPVTHDGGDHAARIANFYSALKDGVLFPRWGEYLNWGYGHPVLMFLYPFSSYIASLFHVVGFSYADSLKWVFASGYILSGVSMYLWAKRQFGEYFAINAALLYQFGPYRFVDMYVRGAIGEHMAFIFPPFILLSILLFFDKKGRGRYLSAVGVTLFTALLLLAHNAISLMFLPVFAGYALMLAIHNKDYKGLFILFGSFVYGFLLSSFFTIPAFFEGKFTLRDIVTGDEYKKRFIQPISLLYGDWNYGITGQFTVQLGAVHIAGTIITAVLLISNRVKKFKSLLWMMVVYFAFSLFVMTQYSNFIYEIITTLKKFQFPWRFLSLTVFTSSVLGSVIFLGVKNEKAKKVILFLFISITLITTASYWKAKQYTEVPDSFYEKVYYGTTDTGESAPIWSVRFMEKEAQSRAEVIDGRADIHEVSRSSVKHEYRINTLTPTAQIRENTLYFPGWKVMVNGMEVPIQFQDPSSRGLITYTVPSGKNQVVVLFTQTRLRMVSSLISIVLFLTLIGLTVYILRYVHKKN